MVNAGDVMHPSAAMPVYVVEEAATQDAQSSSLGWGALAAAAVAGAAVGHAASKKSGAQAAAQQPAHQATAAEKLLDGMAEQQQLAALQQRRAMLSVGGQSKPAPKPARTVTMSAATME